MAAKSGWVVRFFIYGISNLVGYLVPNPIYTYKYREKFDDKVIQTEGEIY